MRRLLQSWHWRSSSCSQRPDMRQYPGTCLEPPATASADNLIYRQKAELQQMTEFDFNISKMPMKKTKPARAVAIAQCRAGHRSPVFCQVLSSSSPSTFRFGSAAGAPRIQAGPRLCTKHRPRLARCMHVIAYLACPACLSSDALVASSQTAAPKYILCFSTPVTPIALAVCEAHEDVMLVHDY